MLDSYILGWPKSPRGFFHKIKDTFFIFNNNIIDLDILSMSAISCLMKHWLFSINVSIWLLSTSTGLPNQGALSSKKSQTWNFANHFWHIWSVTAPSPYTAQIFFFAFQLCFYLSWIIKHNMPKMLCFILSLMLKWLHKNSPILLVFFNAHWYDSCHNTI